MSPEKFIKYNILWNWKAEMAKQFTDEELKQILAEHQLWLDSGREQGKQADFSGKNLDQTNLSGVNLQEAILIEASFFAANLERANFTKAQLAKAIFLNAYLPQANFTEANLLAATFREASVMNANFERANLTKSSFYAAHLQGSNFNGANLTGADLVAAILERANFSNANLTEASFVNVVDDYSTAMIEGAKFDNANLQGVVFEAGNLSNTTSLPQSIQQYEETINQLQNKLHQIEVALQNNEADQEEVQKSQAKIDKLNEEIERVKSSKEKAEKELDDLKQGISQRIDDAKDSLKRALENTDTQIKNNSKYAKWFGWGGMAVFSIAFCALTGIPIYIWCNNLFPENNWHLLFYTFPVIAMILIATTLLRHQKSLLNEVRHFSNMKHQIELYSGLLEASQHAAASFGDPKKADEYVQQTFTQIRDRLLQVQLPHDQPLAPASEEPADANHLIGLLSKIVDLVSKKMG